MLLLRAKVDLEVIARKIYVVVHTLTALSRDFSSFSEESKDFFTYRLSATGGLNS